MKKLISLLNVAAFVSIPSNLVVSCNSVFSYSKLDANIANWDITADGIFNSQVTDDVAADGGTADIDKGTDYPFILNERKAISDFYTTGTAVNAYNFFGASFVWYENHVKDYTNGILRDENNNQYTNSPTQTLDVPKSIDSLFHIFDINLFRLELNKSYKFQDPSDSNYFLYANNKQDGEAVHLLDDNSTTYVKPNTTSSTKGTVAGQIVFGFTIGVNPNVSSQFYSSSNYRVGYTNDHQYNEYNVIQGVFIYDFGIQ